MIFQRIVAMAVKTNLPYPKDDYLEVLASFYAGINGEESFDPVKE